VIELSEGSTAKKAIFHDGETNSNIIFKGTNIEYAEGSMVAGTITEILFFNGDSEKMFEVTDFKKGAFTLMENLRGDDGIGDILALIMTGKDTIEGSGLGDEMFFDKGNDKLDGGNGDDMLRAGRGTDMLTGGKGSDFFLQTEDGGHDIITDFHAKGGEGVQDLLMGTRDAVTLQKDGDDLIVTFKEVDVGFILLGIQKSEITHADFGGFP
jgi:Ca2+-binding RTX toxin-like protein